MLSVLRSWEIILVPFSGRRNPLSAGRGVQAHTPLQPGGAAPRLQPLLSPRWIPERIPLSCQHGGTQAHPPDRRTVPGTSALPDFLPFSSAPLDSARVRANGAGMSRLKMLSDAKALSAKATCTLDGSWRAPSSSPPRGSPPLPCLPLQPVKCGQFLIAPALEGGCNSASF